MNSTEVYVPPAGADEAWVLENAQTCDDCSSLFKNEHLCVDDGLAYCKSCRPNLHAECELSRQLEPWENHLDNHPDDWEHRLVYADWLEEEERAVEMAGLARAQRFMGTCRCNPSSWHSWWNNVGYEYCDIPKVCFLNLVGGETIHAGYDRGIRYPTRRAAEQALADVFARDDGYAIYLKACEEMSDL